MQAVLAPPRRPGHVIDTRLSAGLAGASGYVGRELARIIGGHPSLALAAAQARSDGFDDLDAEALAYCDVVFLALPREAGRVLGQALAAEGTPVVDLADGFRLEPGWTYGLTELFRDEIEGSRRVANPGCYPTAALLALAPLAEAGLLAGPPVIDGKSGVSGAGARQASGRTSPTSTAASRRTRPSGIVTSASSSARSAAWPVSPYPSSSRPTWRPTAAASRSRATRRCASPSTRRRSSICTASATRTSSSSA